MGNLKQHIQVVFSAIVSVVLLTAPLYAVDLPHELVSMNAVVEDNLSETRSTADTLEVPAAEDVDEGYARVYFADNEAWDAVPAGTPVRFRSRGNRLVGHTSRGVESMSVAGIYSGNAAVELEDGGVYVVSYTPREPLLSDPAKVAGYTPPPTENDIELLPETEERVTFDVQPAFSLGLVGSAAGAAIATQPDDEDELASEAEVWTTLAVGGLLGVLVGSIIGFGRTEQRSPDNIAENRSRRGELAREQQQVQSQNEELLEAANEEIREQNNQLGFVLLEEVRSGQTTHLWVSE